MIFPEGFLAHLRVCPGFKEAEFINAHILPAPVSIRLNPTKPGFNVQGLEKVPWSDSGFYLDERPLFSHDPLWHAGAYYVQEASGMFVEYLFNRLRKNDDPITVLDLCAAPGGKSTLLSSLLRQDDFLVSNEVIRSRVHILSENLTKWGNDNTLITNNDPSAFTSLEQQFDIILVDAPCSGSGLFRKDEKAMREWSMENVAHCSKRQQRILQDIYPALKDNGILIYTTCSYSKEENEDIVAWMLNTFSCSMEDLGDINMPGITQSEYGFRFYPDQVKGEGFFAAAVRKLTSYSAEHSPTRHAPQKTIALSEEEIKPVSPFIANNIQLFNWRENIYGFHKNQYTIIKKFTSLQWVQPGIAIGKMVAGRLTPAHALALSHMRSRAVPFIETGKKNAVAYLKKETFDTEFIHQMIDSNTENKNAYYGWHLVTFHSVPLGWVKVLNNRINNYYPTEWRIKK